MTPIVVSIAAGNRSRYLRASLYLIRSRLIGLAVIGLVLIGLGAGVLGASVWDGVLLIAFGCALFIGLSLLPWRIRGALAKQPATATVITITDQRIREETELTIVDASWEIVERVVELRTDFILLQGPRLPLMVVPKDALSPGDEERLREILPA